MPAPLSFTVTDTDLRAAFAQAKAAGGGLTVQLRRGITGAGTVGKKAVQAKAAGFSSRIPGAVKVAASFSAKSAGVRVYVDAKKAPEAAALNNHGKSGTFRHPVYPDTTKPRKEWNWVNQEAQPFFDDPLRQAVPKMDAAMLAALRDFERKAGFV